MNISGILVTATPGSAAALRRRLEGIAGVEVHVTAPSEQLVVTVEADSDETAHNALATLERLEEVQCAALVYHYRDPVGEEA
jgi:periplasmic nitrate reductase NapD